ncbi:MAG: hypothetical protein PHV42_04055, partial [Candidatus Pacebacteria bacterium]|nr:hypothetical protein [Candidatus Paceibacterota bacterium]
LTEPEIRISAVPYFFNNNDSLTFSWSANGEPFTSGQSPDGKSILLRQDGQTGSALISLTVKNNASFLQSAQTQTSLLLPNIAKTTATSI